MLIVHDLSSRIRSWQSRTKGPRGHYVVQPGFVVTIEPGVYINRWLTERWKAEGRHTQFIDYAMFDRHAAFGGIRIEDDILVTADGRRELGPHIARSRADVELACAGEY